MPAECPRNHRCMWRTRLAALRRTRGRWVRVPKYIHRLSHCAHSFGGKTGEGDRRAGRQGAGTRGRGQAGRGEDKGPGKGQGASSSRQSSSHPIHHPPSINKPRPVTPTSIALRPDVARDCTRARIPHFATPPPTRCTRWIRICIARWTAGGVLVAWRPGDCRCQRFSRDSPRPTSSRLPPADCALPRPSDLASSPHLCAPQGLFF